MKFLQLDSRGVAHHFLLALIVVGVAVVGTYYILQSNTNTAAYAAFSDAYSCQDGQVVVGADCYADPMNTTPSDCAHDYYGTCYQTVTPAKHITSPATVQPVGVPSNYNYGTTGICKTDSEIAIRVKRTDSQFVIKEGSGYTNTKDNWKLFVNQGSTQHEVVIGTNKVDTYYGIPVRDGDIRISVGDGNMGGDEYAGTAADLNKCNAETATPPPAELPAPTLSAKATSKTNFTVQYTGLSSERPQIEINYGRADTGTTNSYAGGSNKAPSSSSYVVSNLQPGTKYIVRASYYSTSKATTKSYTTPITVTTQPPTKYAVPRLSKIKVSNSKIQYSWSASTIGRQGLSIEAVSSKGKVYGLKAGIKAQSGSASSSVGFLPANDTYRLRVTYYATEVATQPTRTALTSPVVIPNEDTSTIGCKLDMPSSAKNGQTITATYTLTNKGPLPFTGKAHLEAYMQTINAYNGDQGLVENDFKIGTIKAGKSMTVKQKLTVKGPKTGGNKPVRVTVRGFIIDEKAKTNAARNCFDRTIKVTN